MSTVLISGSSGFVGQNLIHFLNKKAVHTHTLGRANADYLWSNLSGITDDIEAYIHLAGKAHDVSNTSGADEYFKVNTDLTIRLFEHFLQSKAEVFIYMSSVKAAADTVEGILTEELSPNPKTPYGQSKRKAEEYILNANLPEGKRAIILRPCMIHGPGNKGNLNLLYKFVQKGIPYPLAAFENRRSFLSIANLNFVIAGIIENKNISSGIYQVADDESLSTNELVKLIAKCISKKPSLLKIPVSMMSGLAKIGGALKLPLNPDRLKKLTESYVVSNNKVKQALNIGTMPVSAKDGLRETIKSFNK
ncbi:nucleoside-diphosphate-sugar epimerase [Owenweeksia hongkongensis DSM 17368]|uniref:Nucleoside-diphosphate-sugar epimerase n=1 Tax=Owenweeksia hongkongensis (strain DSM 17368 / CIP 108786 / JCM 12287 / NRRL B-23963 / UST20020801) TaxID=926562 RepID=G8R4V2_OWEHD|nr:NAD-dependent epimerase/dehydratase family protein [Owenweeksia hongkongensis]AEV34266.1 nucleoside-diphosphate-sugar epimerase [Owenweeksia hongkongensis DSM 17368]